MAMDKSLRFALFSVMILLGLGAVILLSTMGWQGGDRSDDFIKPFHQATYIGIGALVAFGLAKLDYQRWKKWVWFLFGLAALLLLLCFIPPFASPSKGAHRWISLSSIGLPFLRFQPSELARLAIIVFLAWWFDRFHLRRTELRKGFIYPLLIVLALTAMITIEVDLGTTALIVAVTLSMMFLAGVRFLYLVGLGALAVAGLFGAVKLVPERMDRMTSFLDFENRDKYKTGEGHQQEQAMLAFGSGGISGLGLGNGRQKMDFLPEAHTDFIYPMIGEELGLPATMAVLLCFAVILINGLAVCARAPDVFGRLLGSGIIIMICGQAAVNMCVATYLLPNKGMPLPFLSYGGSNIVSCLAAFGIVLSIQRAVKRLPDAGLVLSQKKVTVTV